MKRRAFLQAIGAAAAVTTATRSLSARQTPEFDVVVVGAGSSGCVVASRLSADAERRVLLIEAGPARSTDPAITTPARWVSLIGSDVDWNYEAAATPGLDGRAVRWPRGRLIGGSSAINAMAYVRGHRGCYDAWAAAAGPAWSFNAVLPIFKALETNSRGPSEYLGGAGPLAVSDTTDPHAGHMAFLEAARELGFAGSPTWDFNGAQQESGAGFYQKNIRAGARHSAADAFLAPVLGRRNLTVWANTTAHRLVIERGRVIGIDVVRDGTPIRVAVSSEVVLSAGVIESPKLLMLSGIGPADALKRVGVTPLVDAPDVGSNLHDHPRVSLRWQSQQPLPGSTVSAGLFVHARGSTQGESSSRIPDLQFYVGRGLDVVDQFITLTVALSTPRSRGALALRSASPDDAPVIRPAYFAEPEDLDTLAEGVRLARALSDTKAYAKLRGAPVDPKAGEESADATRAFVRRAADTIFHPVGTCRMGSDERAVVDGMLRVRGVAGVRVADGSVMPVGVNSQTHAACLLIGAKAAEFIRR